ncbi:PDDEXK nuclease domain-containing protein [Thiocapsa bogorovii]|uniref:PDDEXK nuclease domain-containing protein n=1 Tax=Thiocapsa bogorovii TaxID=521689 RepID=UPI001E5FB944|nr:PDDEXK nuclease domain-containing protein [Thiocapsa bogorovii]UHD16484.1 PDDEXK nuclease domain-containing protein [Thiocapsa bogorovii]
MSEPNDLTEASERLLGELRGMIADAREQLAQTANAALTMLYWNLGSRLHREILGEKRAEYGKRIVAAVGRQLHAEFGSGFSEKNLWRMMQFAELFPDGKILATLSRQLGWSHFKELLPLDQPMQREFYAEMCRIERWSVRTLRNKIGSLLYERTAISKKPEEVAKAEIAALRNEDRLTPDLVFRDPYILDFLGLKDRYLEKDLEDAILREIEAFLLALGEGFAFVGRQVRIQIDSDDFYLDLLFYHRRLKRLVAIDLKLGDFKAEHKGQMELYLRWLAKHEQQPGEEPPLGIILCAGKKEEQIELLELDRSGIHVAEYLTALPPRELLKQKLHAAIESSRARLENREGGGE